MRIVSTTYPKIDTLFNRLPNFKVDVGDVRVPELAQIATWYVTEKIDGTNVRIVFERVDDALLNVQIRGRTDDAQLNPDLLNVVAEIAQRVSPVARDVMAKHSLSSLVLHGEGYGPKIGHVGARYAPTHNFALFDVAANGRWLDVGQVAELAQRATLTTVPTLGTDVDVPSVVRTVASGFHSVLAEDQTLLAEGVVCRTWYPLYDRRGNRLIFKLKTRDLK